MTHAEMIEVIKAHKAGANIQGWSLPGVSDHEKGWCDLSDPNWDFNRVAFRVKPEPPKPREYWMQLTSTGMFVDLRKERPPAEHLCTGVEVIHLREVLP